MHAVFCWAPVGFVSWVTLGSITFCHHHRWCCCWDISFCLNPPCVIKVPLCISSPSLSENLSCPLMGVCWWVSLLVGFGLQCHLCLQWRFCPMCGALQHCCIRTCHFLICQSDRSWVANWQCELRAEASSLRQAVLEKLPFSLCHRDSKSPTFLPVAGLLSSRIRPDCKSLLSNHLLSNTPFTHRGPQTTRSCQLWRNIT